MMASWLAKVRSSVGRRGRSRVHDVLEHLCRTRARVELEPITETVQRSGALVTNVEQVHDDTFVVDRPTIGGLLRPLGRFERFHLTFEGTSGLMSAETRALGRVRIDSGTGDVLYGYRLELPKSLQAVDQRRALRALMGGDLVREGELHVLSHRGPLHGLIEDLGASEAKLRCRNAGARLAPGQPGWFSLSLPEPVGSVQADVSIVAVEPADDGHVLVRVSFRERNERIAQALKG